MKAISWCLFSALLLTTFTMIHCNKNPAEPAKIENGLLVHLKPSAHRSLHRRRHSGRQKDGNAMAIHGGSSQPDYWPLDGEPEVEGLTPVRLEMGPTEWADTGGSEGSEERPHAYNTGHKTHAPMRAKDFMWERSSAGKHTHSGHSAGSQKQIEGLQNLASKLHMMLSDRTASKHTTPLDTGATHANTDKGNAWEWRSGNMTDTHGKNTVTCDHHVDCPLGSCCDLRKHFCEVHNRSLNNKCYADCMCEEGFRCYTKFHQSQRVKQKRGRCVDPDMVNMNQGAFITT
ncbi:draxin-B-like [Alosa sapidissima]|uniref:draxin-B-like n=1 Tax=Alosa sapidissima TaxID=34773 RepID=UPI001C0A1DE8|nr:draxin-B-like [Alosa sapidissima]